MLRFEIITATAQTAITELIAQSPVLNSDDFADYAQIVMINSDDADTRALAYDDAAINEIADLMTEHCKKNHLSC